MIAVALIPDPFHTAWAREATYAMQQTATYSITSSALASVAIMEDPCARLNPRLLRVPSHSRRWGWSSEFVLDLGVRGSAQLGSRRFTKTTLVESRQSYLSTQTIAHATAASPISRQLVGASRVGRHLTTEPELYGFRKRIRHRYNHCQQSQHQHVHRRPELQIRRLGVLIGRERKRSDAPQRSDSAQRQEGYSDPLVGA